MSVRLRTAVALGDPGDFWAVLLVWKADDPKDLEGDPTPPRPPDEQIEIGPFESQEAATSYVAGDLRTWLQAQGLDGKWSDVPVYATQRGPLQVVRKAVTQ